MLYNIGSFKFDSDRMILLNSDITKEDYSYVCNAIESDNSYENELLFLRKSLSNNVNMNNKVIKNAGIILTFNCNLRCNYCSQNSEDGSTNEITIEDIEVFVRDVVKKRIVSSVFLNKARNIEFYFTGGGEPTYDWNRFKQAVILIENVCQEYSVNLTLGLATNGFLNDEKRKFIANHFKKVMVSYDGMPKIQNKNRSCVNKNETSSIVEKTIKYLANHKIETMVRTTVWQNDIDKLTQMFMYIYENFKDISSWDICPVAPAGRAISIMKKDKGLNENNFVSAYLCLLDLAKSKKCDFDITTPILSSTTCGFSCGGVGPYIKRPWLFPNGKISSCSDSSEIMTQLGKIENGKIIWFENLYDPLLEMGYKKFQTCKNCIAFKVCGSGCPLKHIREEQFLTGMLDWECSMQCEYFEIILKKVALGEEYMGWRTVKIEIPSTSDLNILKLVYQPN